MSREEKAAKVGQACNEALKVAKEEGHIRYLSSVSQKERIKKICDKHRVSHDHVTNLIKGSLLSEG